MGRVALNREAELHGGRPRALDELEVRCEPRRRDATFVLQLLGAERARVAARRSADSRRAAAVIHPCTACVTRTACPTGRRLAGPCTCRTGWRRRGRRIFPIDARRCGRLFGRRRGVRRRARLGRGDRIRATIVRSRRTRSESREQCVSVVRPKPRGPRCATQCNRRAVELEDRSVLDRLRRPRTRACRTTHLDCSLEGCEPRFGSAANRAPWRRRRRPRSSR